MNSYFVAKVIDLGVDFSALNKKQVIRLFIAFTAPYVVMHRGGVARLFQVDMEFGVRLKADFET